MYVKIMKLNLGAHTQGPTGTTHSGLSNSTRSETPCFLKYLILSELVENY